MLSPARTQRLVSTSLSSLVVTALAACSSSPDQPKPEDAAAQPAAQAPAHAPGAAAPAAQQQPPKPGTQELVQQKQAMLVKTALDNATALREQGNYEEARAQLEQVLLMDPGNTQALVAYNEIQQLQGERAGDIATTGDTVRQRFAAKAQAMKLEAEEYFRLGNDAVSRAEYDAAIRDFERVAQSIKWSTMDVEWGDLPARNDAALASARQQRDAAVRSERETKLKEAVQQVRSDEDQERMRQAERVKNLLESANLKYEKGDYEGAMALCDEVLKIEPTSATAKDLRREANEARRAVRTADFQKHRDEQFRRFKRDIEELRVPYSNGLEPPDADYWNRVVQRQPTGVAGLEDASTIDNKRLRDQIKATHIPVVNFQDNELKDVCTVLTNLSGITIIASPKALTELESGGALVTLSNMTNLTLESILNIVTKSLGEGKFAWTVRNGVVQITTLVDAYGETKIRPHGVQDLTFGRTDFKGPKIAGIPLPNKYGDSPEDSVFAADLEKTTTITVEDLITLIKENVAKETWELGDKKFSIDKAASDQILVVHTPEVQQEIEDFLNDLRRFTSTVVEIESRFVEITDAFVQEFGVDFRGLGGVAGTGVNLDDVTSFGEDQASAGLDNLGTGSTGTASPSAGAFFHNSHTDSKLRSENIQDSSIGSILSTSGGGAFQFAILKHNQVNMIVKAVEKSANATEVMAPELTVFNTERAYVSVINEVSFLQDFDVDVANTAFIANPTIGVLQEGVVLDVKPTISYDRKFVTLDVRASVATLERPIPTFTTTLGGFSTAVTFQLPRLEVQNANTTVIVPDGGAVILGGLKTVNYQNARAEIPWLARIPVLGILFRDKGVADESKSLVILVRADIRDLTPYREAQPAR